VGVRQLSLGRIGVRSQKSLKTAVLGDMLSYYEYIVVYVAIGLSYRDIEERIENDVNTVVCCK